MDHNPCREIKANFLMHFRNRANARIELINSMIKRVEEGVMTEEYQLTAEEYLESYQTWQDSTVWDSVRNDKQWAMNALLSEVGELAQLEEKRVRKGKEVTANMIADEMGDVLWNVSNILNIYGISMADVMEGNVVKIEKRLAKKDD